MDFRKENHFETVCFKMLSEPARNFFSQVMRKDSHNKSRYYGLLQDFDFDLLYRPCNVGFDGNGPANPTSQEISTTDTSASA